VSAWATDPMPGVSQPEHARRRRSASPPEKFTLFQGLINAPPCYWFMLSFVARYATAPLRRASRLGAWCLGAWAWPRHGPQPQHNCTAQC
jgi:hypothetical protein